MISSNIRPSLVISPDSRRSLSAGTRARRLALLTGPAVVVSVAYLDPGNIAVNFQAGAGYGYQLLWVVVVANAIAMLFQALSAKLGIVTGRNLAEHCREQFPAPVVWAMWAISEIAAIATDLAEFVGAAIGFSLLFGVSIVDGMIVTAVATSAILLLQGYGFRPIELTIAGFVAVVGIAFVLQLLILDPDWHAIAVHSVVPSLGDGSATMLAAGIIGATVMPHALFLHSSLTQDRVVVTNDTQRRFLVRFSRGEVVAALGLSGVINMAILTAAAALYGSGGGDASVEIADVYRRLLESIGAGAAGIFLAALLASGISSSVVGTMAGQVIMQGFVRIRSPLWLRRLATMTPSFAILFWCGDATNALVLSQVVLSLTLPVPLVALLIVTSKPTVMGPFANRGTTRVIAVLATAVIVLLNLVLVLQGAGVPMP